MTQPPDHPPSPGLRERLAGIPDPRGLLEGLFAHSPVPYIIFRADGHPLVNNRAYRDMFGAEPPPEYNVLRDEVIDRLGLREPIERAFRGEPVETPVIWYDPKELSHIEVKHARRVAISSSFFPLRGDSGEVAFVGVAFRDVTAERESAERLRHTLDAAEVGTWDWNIAENRVDWSPNIERIFRLPPGSFAGTYEAWLALVHPDDRAWLGARVRASLEAGNSYEVPEFRYLRADGSTGWQSARGHVIRDEQGRAQRLRGVVFDVTEQVQARRRIEELARALREGEARYRTFVEQSSEGIWRVELEAPVPVELDADEQIERFYARGYLAECNDVMARMYGYDTAAELIGKRLGDLLVRDDPANVEYLRAFIESGYRLENAESHEVDREGRPKVLHNSLVGVVENGRLLRAWGTQRDVTAQVEARNQAEAASRAKDEFLAMLGHELRNPLSPILTALELMKLRDQVAFQKERSIIERQVKHVVRLVDDLLDVSRMTRGTVSLQRRRLDVADVIASAIESTSPLLEQRAHRLVVDVPRGLIIDGDATRLGQVFTNLLNNAAKYTPRAGTITVRAGRTGNQVRLSVEDTGIGIRAEILPRIFDLFVQEQQALDRSEGGLGLGLAIARSLVSLHGGTIEAHSDGPGQGSEFVVRLPLSDQVTVAPGAAAAVPHNDADGWRVLVVDDNEDAADLLADVLTGWGHSVRVAHDGPEALKLTAGFTPELALLDIGLPVMDGYELARRLRAAFPAVRLLAVTGYGQESDRRAAHHAGFDGHLVKPVDLASLQKTLASMTGQPNG